MTFAACACDILFAERFAFIEVKYKTRGGCGTAIPTWG